MGKASTVWIVLVAVWLNPIAATAGDWDQINKREFHDDEVATTSEFPAWFKHSFYDLREDLAEVRQAGKRGLLIFLSEAHCSYCKMMTANTLAQQDIRDRLVKHFDVVGFEVINDIELTDWHGKAVSMKQFVMRERAYVTPTLIFLDPGGKRLLQISGYYPPARFRGVLDYLLDEHAAGQTLAEFLATREPLRSRPGATIERDAGLFSSPPYALDRRGAPAKRPLLVLMERPNCSACMRFHRRGLTDPKVRQLVKKFEAVQVDRSKDGTRILTPDGQRLTGRQWARQLAVTDAPTLLIFDERGREVFRIESEVLHMRTAGAMQLVLEKGYLDEPQLQRWRKRKATEKAGARR